MHQMGLSSQEIPGCNRKARATKVDPVGEDKQPQPAVAEGEVRLRRPEPDPAAGLVTVAGPAAPFTYWAGFAWN